jgi:hypothetical protein
MNDEYSYESDAFESDFELDEAGDPPPGELDELELEQALYGETAPSRKRGCGCGCSGKASAKTGARTGADAPQSESGTSGAGATPPPWINQLLQLYRAGRLGWKLGRWIDKQSGRTFGKPISIIGAEFMYRRLGRSRRAEDFVDRLPKSLRRWLYSL